MPKHIDFAIVPKKHSPMYLMHKYWARKPHNVVSTYIKNYTKKGDIVLDPFCGSGVTILEALRLKRKAVGVDIDPMSSFITKCTGIPIDLINLEKEFDLIKHNIKPKIDLLFSTVCNKCNRKSTITHVVWDYNINAKNKTHIDEIWFVCNFCASKKKGLLIKKPNKDDIEFYNNIAKQRIPNWFPDNELVWNTRINVHKGEKISDLFTARALMSLSLILNEIEKVTDQSIKQILKFVFTSSLAQASKMIPYQGGLQSGGASWKTRGYWIPKKHFEINTWNCFENRFIRIKNGKRESNEYFKSNWKEAQHFKELQDDKTVLILNGSALDLNKIPTESIDYVFTDPPYGDSVPYMELHYMWSSWLKFSPNFEEEIIISDSPIRERRSENLYSQMLLEAFKEIFRVLKPNHYLTVTFHNADIGIYNSVIRSIKFAGFDLEKILYQPPAHPSPKAMLAPYGSAEGDYYIRFIRTKFKKGILTDNDIDKMRFEKIVIESIKKILAERGEPVTFNDILKSIYIDLDNAGYLTAVTTEKIQKIIDNYKDKEFVFIKSQGWWFKDPEKYFLHITPLEDRVEKFVIQILRKKVKVSYDDVIQEIFLHLKNSLTPEPSKVKKILEEYAQPTKDKKWMIRSIVEKRVSDHSQIIGNLAEIGRKIGYLISIGKREQGDLYHDKTLSYLVDKNIIGLHEKERDIDVLWIREGKVHYAFEVEYTTGITEALVRGSYIKNEKAIKVLIIPEEREKLLFKKINAPIFEEKIIKDKWRFIFFKEIDEFYIQNKRKKNIHEDSFCQLFKELKEDKFKQLSLNYD